MSRKPHKKKKSANFRFFATFEEANEADAKEKAALSPEEHLNNATLMIQRLYQEELKKPMDKALRFNK